MVKQWSGIVPLILNSYTVYTHNTAEYTYYMYNYTYMYKFMYMFIWPGLDTSYDMYLWVKLKKLRVKQSGFKTSKPTFPTILTKTLIFKGEAQFKKVLCQS